MSANQSMPKRAEKHGRANTAEYHVWAMMKQRCLNPVATGYENYGGRGVTVCPRWRYSFAAFLEDMGLRSSDRHELDRIDNSGNYEPGNCRWVTLKEQSRNKRVNRLVTHAGKTMTLVEWAEFAGIRYSMLKGRLAIGWSFERAITQPRRKYPVRAK